MTYMLDPESAVRRRIAVNTGDNTLGAAVAAYRTPVLLLAFGAALLVITLAGFSLLSVLVAGVLAAMGIYAWRVPVQPAPSPASGGTGD